MRCSAVEARGSTAHCGSGPCRANRPAEQGVSLIELLIVVAVSALMAAAIVPSIVRQTRTSDQARWRNDLESVAQAVKLYRVDMRHWPSDVGQLLGRPEPGSTSLTGAPISPGLRWRGPYLDNLSRSAAGDGFRSARSSTIRDGFAVVSWRDGQYLQVEVANVPEEEARILSRTIDGDTVVGVSSLTAEREEAGRVRFLPDTGGTGSLLFLAARADP